jgi:hypothetical protein
MAPKPQAMLIEKHTAIGLYSAGFCIKMPMSKTISAIAPATKNNWDIFFIWIFALQVSGYRLQGCVADWPKVIAFVFHATCDPVTCN